MISFLQCIIFEQISYSEFPLTKIPREENWVRLSWSNSALFTSSWAKWWEQWWVMLRIRCTQYYRSSWNSRCRGMDYLSCHMWYQLGPVLAYSDHRLPCPPKRHLANILEWHWLKNRKKKEKNFRIFIKKCIFCT